MPGLGKALKRSIADSYEYLGLVLFCSFIWFGVVIAVLSTAKLPLPPATRLGMLALLYVLLVSPATAGVFLVAQKIATRDDPCALDLFRGFRGFLVPAWRLGAWQALITALLAANSWFYLTRAMPWKLLTVFFVYLLLAWLMSVVYQYPFLVEQNPGTPKVIKRAFLLTLDNPGFTGAVFLVIIVLTCVCTFTLVGLPLLYAGMAGIIATRAARSLFIKYEILPPEPEPEPVADEPWKVPE